MAEFDKRLIIGGGLAGIAAAYWCKHQNPGLQVYLLEKEKTLLSWTLRKNPGEVPLGRILEPSCCTEEDYPRGLQQAVNLIESWPALLTRDWLQSLGVSVQVSENGMLFAGSAKSLATCLEKSLLDVGVEVRTGYAVESISRQPDGTFRVWSRQGDPESGGQLLLATGGERNHGMAMARELGAQTEASLPAYVRIKLTGPKWVGQLGPLERTIRLRCPKSGLETSGLATLSPRGLEGEAVSGLSCRLALDWSQRRYRLQLLLDWIPEATASMVRGELNDRCLGGRRKSIGSEPLFDFSERQWRAILSGCRIDPDTPWLRLKNRQLQMLLQQLKGQLTSFEGMGLPSAERAWVGGIAPESVDWRTGQSVFTPGLYFAGDILDLLGGPGGFNLNLVWATSHLAARSMALPEG